MSIILWFVATFTIFLLLEVKIPANVPYIPYEYFAACFAVIVFITIKRFHDLNKSWLHLFTLLIPVYNVFIALTLPFKKGADYPNNFGEKPGGGLSVIKRSVIWLGLFFLFTAGSLVIIILVVGIETETANEEQKTKVKLRYANGSLKEKCTFIKNKYGEFMLDGQYTYWYDNGQIAVNCFYDRCKIINNDSRKPFDEEPENWDLQMAEFAMQDNVIQRKGTWISWYKDGKKRGKCRHKNRMLEGRYTKWWPDGHKALDCFYRKGKKNGREIQWFDNGQKSFECTYKKDKKNGREISWHKNGTKAHSCVYKNGKKEGLEIHWYENGNKLYEYSYNHGIREGWGINNRKAAQISQMCSYKNGKKDGWEIHWHANGTKAYECFFINGEKDKWEISWRENRQKSKECYYENCKKVGFETLWYDNGQKSYQCPYKKGEKDGIEIDWQKDGKKSRESTYKNGERDGLEVCWQEDGKKSEMCTYKNGQKDGWEIHWHANGTKAYECFFINGEKDKWEISWRENRQKSKECYYENCKKVGFETLWYDNGQKSYQCHYKDGKKDGIEIDWQKDGKKSRESTYKNGERDGLEVCWQEDGKKSEMCTYKNGQKDGWEIIWDKEGQKMYECHYKDGKKDGLEVCWQVYGVKLEECSYKNGKKDGLNTLWHFYEPQPIHWVWDLIGDRWYQSEYIDDQKEGFEIYWGPDGEIEEEFTYYNEVKGEDEDGWFVNATVYYDSDTSAAQVPFTESWPDGQKLKEGFLQNGLRTGKYLEWHRNGQLRRENNYICGKKNGKLTRWHNNGQLHNLCYYKDGKKHGLETQWYENGQKQRECMYRSGHKHGKSTQWYDNGRIRVESQYYYDEHLQMTKWNEKGKIIISRVLSDKKYCVSPDLFNNEAKFVTGGEPGSGGENWYWEIDGKYLTWGSDTVRIKPSSGVHTIVWCYYGKTKSDTIYCHISEPNTFIVNYNPKSCSFRIDKLYHTPDRYGKSVELKVKGEPQKEPLSFSVTNYKATCECVARLHSNGKIVVPFPRYNSRTDLEEYLDRVRVTLLQCEGEDCCEYDLQSIEFNYVTLDDKPVQVVYHTRQKRFYLR